MTVTPACKRSFPKSLLLLAVVAASSRSALPQGGCACNAASGQVLFSLSGFTPNDSFGSPVRGAGDVNGDGFSDIIVGARLAGNNGTNSGYIRVFSGNTGVLLYSKLGDGPGDQFGSAVAGAGDVNGDGFSDFVVGAPLDDNNGPDSGMVRVFSGATGATLFSWNGDSAGDQLGYSVGSAGDVNGDGFSDLIAGAPYDDNGGGASGSARVFSGATGQIMFTFSGNIANLLLGTCVGSLGDVNGDGLADVFAGGPGFGAVVGGVQTSLQGRLSVFSGSTGALIYSRLAGASQSAYGFGADAAGIGDVTGDGFGDFVVAAPWSPYLFPANPGVVHIYSGAITGSTPLYTVSGAAFGFASGFGNLSAGRGDVNGDAVLDFAVSGRVLSGANGALINYIPGAYEICIVGDTNGDGVSEVAVGVTSPVGLVQIVSGLCSASGGPFTLTMCQPAGPGSIQIRNLNGVSSSSYFTALSFDPANASAVGSGWWAGLHIGFNDIVSQFLSGQPPFVGVLSSIGESTFNIPPGVLTSFTGITVYGVTRSYSPATLYFLSSTTVAVLTLQ